MGPGQARTGPDRTDEAAPNGGRKLDAGCARARCETVAREQERIYPPQLASVCRAIEGGKMASLDLTARTRGRCIHGCSRRDSMLRAAVSHLAKIAHADSRIHRVLRTYLTKHGVHVHATSANGAYQARERQKILRLLHAQSRPRGGEQRFGRRQLSRWPASVDRSTEYGAAACAPAHGCPAAPVLVPHAARGTRRGTRLSCTRYIRGTGTGLGELLLRREDVEKGNRDKEKTNGCLFSSRGRRGAGAVQYHDSEAS